MSNKKPLRPTTKVLIKKLLLNGYLRRRFNHNDEEGYMLYEGNKIPVRFFPEKYVKPVKDLLKRDDKGNYTFNLSKVRQLNGHAFMKKQYRKNKAETKNSLDETESSRTQI